MPPAAQDEARRDEDGQGTAINAPGFPKTLMVKLLIDSLRFGGDKFAVPPRCAFLTRIGWWEESRGRRQTWLVGQIVPPQRAAMILARSFSSVMAMVLVWVRCQKVLVLPFSS